MRLPWQRRAAGRVETERSLAPEAAVHAWRTLPVLHSGIDRRAPLTAASTELADSISRRMRSTGERSRLVHRAGLPEAASAGTVRGLATASGREQRNRMWQRDPNDVDGGGIEIEAADRSDAASPSMQKATERHRKSRLTSVDDALVATLARSRESRPAAPAEEPPPIPDALEREDPAPAPPAGLQRTVIRRRSGTPRPIGLQAPLTPDETRREVDDVAAARTHDQGSPERMTAPHAVAATVGRLHRADVSDVRIRRDREAELLAASEHARAVTRGGEIFIPTSEGPLDSGPGKGLLAHELTHVIQQRRLGRSVPLEHSPAGRRLEADAAMTERHVRGDLGAPAPAATVTEPPSQPAASSQQAAGDDRDDAAIARDIQEEMVASGRAFRMPDGSLVFPGGGGHLPEQRVTPVQTAVVIQRAPEDQASAEPDAPHSAAAAPAAVASSGATRFPAPSPRVAFNSAPPSASAPPAPAQAPAENAPTSPAVTPSIAAPATSAAPPADEPAPIDLDDLARRVYGQVRTQLRSELLIDRERAGLLTDFR
jgi:hypothetical protein